MAAAGAGKAAHRAARARVDDFATDMGDFINAARAEGLDGWIAGVRLGENADPDMTEYLPALLDMAHGINARTGGWLRDRLFLANGGDMGASFTGIADPSAQAGDFFAAMSKEAGAFAFGYKWMELEGHEGRITALMDASPCDPVRACDPRSAADWTTYLGDTLGFDELAAVIATWHPRYPATANVVFVGDSSNSLTLMVKPGKAGLADAPPLAALRQLWPGGPGWRGKVFMNGFLRADTAPRLQDGATADIGMGLYFGDGKGGLQPLPCSLALFRAWPAPAAKALRGAAAD